MARLPIGFFTLLSLCGLSASLQAEWDVTSSSGIYRYDDAGTFLGLRSGTGYSGIAVGASGLFAAYRSSTPHIDRFIGGTFNGSFGAGTGMFSPEDLTLGPDGSLFVATMATSTFDGKVSHFDPATGADLGDFVAHGLGGLSRPAGIVFGLDGNLYVSDITLGAVLRYNGTTGAFLGTFTSGLTLTFAGGMQFGPDNNLYVADTNGSRIAEFNGTTGALIKTIATPSVAPADLAFDSAGLLYVTDIGPGYRLMRYNAQTGASLGRFDGTTGTTAQLATPDYIVYVAPEPSSAVLGCGGVLLLLAGFRGRRRAHA